MLAEFQVAAEDKIMFVLGPMDDSVEEDTATTKALLPAKYIGVRKISYVMQESALAILNTLLGEKIPRDKNSDEELDSDYIEILQLQKLRCKNPQNKLFCTSRLFAKVFQQQCQVFLGSIFSKNNISFFTSLVDSDIVVNDIAMSNALSDDRSISIIVSEDYESALLGSCNSFLYLPSMKNKVCT